MLSSPRVWGCFLSVLARKPDNRVFPTRVGVFLGIKADKAFCPGLPHACGGVSSPLLTARRIWPSSPRVWGCFYRIALLAASFVVFPTRVGVFLKFPHFASRNSGLPHACGGVSGGTIGQTWSSKSSPRVWGCFRARHDGVLRGNVFPTRVGVFPSAGTASSHTSSLPHACGGVSK